MKSFVIAIVLPLSMVISTLARADELPSPCSGSEPGAGTNCMYLVATGNSYDAATGSRILSAVGLTVELEVWIDFGNIAVQGGGFDISFNAPHVMSAEWQWSPELFAFITSSGSLEVNGWTGVQFDDFGGGGFGGSSGSRPGFVQLGTLNVELLQSGTVNFGLDQPYSTGTFPNCFAASSGSSGCVDTGFFSMTVSADSAIDSDDDGILDSQDNCTEQSNSDQRDTDNDGFGNICDADFNQDQTVDLADLAIFRGVFLTSDNDADFDGNGNVDLQDLARLRDLFLLPPGPSGVASVGRQQHRRLR